MKKRLFFSLLLLCLCTSIGIAQQMTINGNVVDKLKEPLVGAAVQIVGTDKGVITDLDGNFTLSASKGAFIEVSHVGFASQTIKIENSNMLSIILGESNVAIDEIVVTAVGIKQQKKKIGYSTQQINTDVIEQSNAINVGAALSGQVAGLNVTNPTGIFQAPAFSLRGKSPLIVKDGIPIETDMFDLPNEDIESVNVLKGTSASALYGSRGKNGAILITTKKAKKDGVEITASLSSMITAGFTVFPTTQNQYGSGSEGKYEFWDGADGGISDGDMTWGPKFVPGAVAKQWNSPLRNKVTGETIPWWGDVKGSIYDNREIYERVATPFIQHDNLSTFLETGSVTKASFSVASRTQRSNTYISGNYAYQKGQVPNTSVNTGGLFFNNEYELSNNLTLSSNISYTKVYSGNYPRYGYGPKNHMYTIMLWMSDDVDITDLKKHMYRPDMDGFRQANYNYAWYNNPYFMSYELTQKHDRDVLNGQMKLLWEITPEFSVQGRASGRQTALFEDMKVPKSYMNYGDSRNGDYKNWNTKQLNIDADLLATYTHAFSRNISTTVNAGASTFFRDYATQYQSTDGLIIPRTYNMGNSQGPVMATNSISRKQINSLYASVNLDLYNAVFLTLTGRNDWSSSLPKANNSYFYPSVALSTMISQYLTLPAGWDYLKAIGSWAVVSSDLDPYSIMATYQRSTMYGSTPSVTYPSGLVNTNIKPQKTTSWEAGLSTAFLKNRIGLDLTYYHSIDENQIIDLPVSEASGFVSRKVNGNVYRTNGLEAVLNLGVVNNKDFSYDVSTNWTYSVTHLSKIYGNKEKFGNLKKGDRADAMYGTVWMKNASGQLILDSKGMPIRDSYVGYIGNQKPDVLFGLQNKIRIKDFLINVNFDGVIGGTLVSTTHQKMWWAGKHPKSTTWRDAEYAAGKPVYVPDGVVVTGGELKRDLNGNVISDTRTYRKNETAVSWQTWSQNYPYRAAVTTKESTEFANTYNRSYIKLRHIGVTYDLTKLIGTKVCKGLDISLYGENLFVIKNIPLLDPDFGASDGDLQDPSSRYIGISATLKL